MDINWEQAKNNLEGVRPYEDGYERDSVHILIDEGDKLQQKLETIKQLLRNAPVPPEEIPDMIMKILVNKA